MKGCFTSLTCGASPDGCVHRAFLVGSLSRHDVGSIAVVLRLELSWHQMKTFPPGSAGRLCGQLILYSQRTLVLCNKKPESLYWTCIICTIFLASFVSEFRAVFRLWLKKINPEGLNIMDKVQDAGE